MMDPEHYEYGSYTTGRKQDYGHHTMNEENGWECYSWDRDDYTETMEMKRPLPNKGWKPFRVYTHVGCYEDFVIVQEAIQFFSDQSYHAILMEVSTETGKVIREIARKNIK